MSHILPHKSWHVYNTKNRERVQRDEAQAQAENKVKQDRADEADREHRLQLLRDRAQRRIGNNGIGDGNSNSDNNKSNDMSIAPTMSLTRISNHRNNGKKHDDMARPSHAPPSTEHLNLFQDFDDKPKLKDTRSNPENEREQREKQKKWDRTIAMHLDTGLDGKAPWYATRLEKVYKNLHNEDPQDEKKLLSRMREDPFVMMESHLAKLDKQRESKRSDRDRKRSRKSHHDDQSISKSAKSSSTGSADAANHDTSKPEMSTMEKLREERRIREQKERLRAREVLNPQAVAKARGDYHAANQYSQQFNPQATRHAGSATATWQRPTQPGASPSYNKQQRRDTGHRSRPY